MMTEVKKTKTFLNEVQQEAKKKLICFSSQIQFNKTKTQET